MVSRGAGFIFRNNKHYPNTDTDTDKSDFDNTVLMEQTYRINNAFAEIVLSDGSIEDIAGKLADICGAKVIITDTFNEVMAEASPGNYTGTGVISGVNNSDDKKVRDFFLKKEVVMNGETAAYISMYKQGKYLTAFDKSAIESAATNAAFILLIKQNIEEIEKSYVNEFLNNLVDGDIESKEEIIERGTLYDLELSSSYLLIVINVKSIDEIFPKRNKIETYNLLRKSFRLIFRTFFPKAEESIAWIRSNNILILYPLPEKLTAGNSHDDSNEFRESIKSFSLEIAKKLKNAIAGNIENINVTIGLGNYRHDISKINISYREALDAIRTGSSVWGINRVYHFDDLGVFKVLSRYPAKGELKKFADEVLGNLITYDTRHETEFMQTLIYLISHNGNQKSAAEELFIHPKTMSYRKKKIEKIINRSLNDYEDIFDISMALKIIKLLERPVY